MEIILFLICFVACIIGAISGIGGGIIIKPIIDSFGIITSDTLSFLSGCTILCMSVVSLYKNKRQNIKLNFVIPIFLGIGASIGGIIGKQLFDIILKSFKNNVILLVQSILLFIINVFILIYMYFKNNLKCKNISSKTVTIILGCFLGIISSFLGIGGGPLNIAIIYYFYSLQPKETALVSLIVVFFSQLFSLISTFYFGIPSFKYSMLIVMCLGGVLGALTGAKIAKKMNDNNIQKFFIIVLIGLIFINIYNILKNLINTI